MPSAFYFFFFSISKFTEIHLIFQRELTFCWKNFKFEHFKRIDVSIFSSRLDHPLRSISHRIRFTLDLNAMQIFSHDIYPYFRRTIDIFNIFFFFSLGISLFIFIVSGNCSESPSIRSDIGCVCVCVYEDIIHVVDIIDINASEMSHESFNIPPSTIIKIVE